MVRVAVGVAGVSFAGLGFAGVGVGVADRRRFAIAVAITTAASAATPASAFALGVGGFAAGRHLAAFQAARQRLCLVGDAAECGDVLRFDARARIGLIAMRHLRGARQRCRADNADAGCIGCDGFIAFAPAVATRFAAAFSTRFAPTVAT